MPKPTSTEGENGATGTIHLTLQGKGGVGKSLIASVLAQYLPEVKGVVDITDHGAGANPYFAASKK